jgi:hypothetical protein
MHMLVKAFTTLAVAAQNATDWYDDDCDDDWYRDCNYRRRHGHSW